MRLSDFDFALPEDRIALRPVHPRDAARLLVVGPDGGLADRSVRDLPELLAPGDVLVLNDTRVIPARLNGVRERDGSTVVVEATLHRRMAPDRWTAFMRPGKRLRVGDTITFRHPRACPGMTIGGEDLRAVVTGKREDGEIALQFELSGPALDQAVSAQGVMPLPPYIAAQRAEDDRDRADYQTVYAREDGSVAAPTAGLHFTPELMARLTERGIEQVYVTLHVGAGTFLPVKTEAIAQHRMHPERGEVSPETAARLNAVRAAGGRIVCAGTTSLRLLESAADEDGTIRPFSGETAIFLTPGHRFRTADVLLTNFHLPRSTLFMLVSAFSGTERMRAAYAHAIAGGYRFYSYGDASLLFRTREPAHPRESGDPGFLS